MRATVQNYALEIACAFLIVASLALVALGCGPAQPPRDVQPEPITDSVTTALGQPVFFGSSLHDHPDLRALAVEQIDAAEAAFPSASYYGITFYVFSGPTVPLGGPSLTAFGSVVSSVRSYYDPDTRSVVLSWGYSGPTGNTDPANFQVVQPVYELSNVRCNCESGLR